MPDASDFNSQRERVRIETLKRLGDAIQAARDAMAPVRRIYPGVPAPTDDELTDAAREGLNALAQHLDEAGAYLEPPVRQSFNELRDALQRAWRLHVRFGERRHGEDYIEAVDQAWSIMSDEVPKLREQLAHEINRVCVSSSSVASASNSSTVNVSLPATPSEATSDATQVKVAKIGARAQIAAAIVLATLGFAGVVWSKAPEPPNRVHSPIDGPRPAQPPSPPTPPADSKPVEGSIHNEAGANKGIQAGTVNVGGDLIVNPPAAPSPPVKETTPPPSRNAVRKKSSEPTSAAYCSRLRELRREGERRLAEIKQDDRWHVTAPFASHWRRGVCESLGAPERCDDWERKRPPVRMMYGTTEPEQRRSAAYNGIADGLYGLTAIIDRMCNPF